MSFVVFNTNPMFGDEFHSFHATLEEALDSRDKCVKGLFECYNREALDGDFDEGEYDPRELENEISNALLVLTREEWTKFKGVTK